MDETLARKDAVTIHDSMDFDKSTFHRILTTRSWAQLKRTFEIYRRKYGADFDRPQKNWYEKTVWAIHQFAMDSDVFFAIALHRDLSHSSTGYTYGASRVFTWRSEIDLGNIAKAHHRVYGQSLVHHIWKNVKGDARDTLLGILQ